MCRGRPGKKDSQENGGGQRKTRKYMWWGVQQWWLHDSFSLTKNGEHNLDAVEDKYIIQKKKKGK